ncbi:hypothetical protein [Candidatus Uabimicrobium sp. HlEnr_7]|uniref:hypothetical protein n=1 Tax=Candidatus Uabimicrobium helgolandensis TaxID=3095367 RepID=UPI003558F7DE
MKKLAFYTITILITFIIVFFGIIALAKQHIKREFLYTEQIIEIHKIAFSYKRLLEISFVIPETRDPVIEDIPLLIPIHWSLRQWGVDYSMYWVK